MKTIGLDLDNTLFKLDTITKVSEEFNTLFTEEDATDWNLTQFPEYFHNRLLELWEDPNHMCNLELLPGVLETLTRLHNEGNKLIIITARNPVLHLPTIDMVNRKLPNLIDLVEFVRHGESKQSLIAKYNIDTWIDDNPDEVMACFNRNIDTYLISNIRTRYNWFLHEVYWLKVIESVSEYFDYE